MLFKNMKCQLFSPEKHNIVTRFYNVIGRLDTNEKITPFLENNSSIKVKSSY